MSNTTHTTQTTRTTRTKLEQLRTLMGDLSDDPELLTLAKSYVTGWVLNEAFGPLTEEEEKEGPEPPRLDVIARLRALMYDHNDYFPRPVPVENPGLEPMLEVIEEYIDGDPRMYGYSERWLDIGGGWLVSVVGGEEPPEGLSEGDMLALWRAWHPLWGEVRADLYEVACGRTYPEPTNLDLVIWLWESAGYGEKRSFVEHFNTKFERLAKQMREQREAASTAPNDEAHP